MRRFEWIEGNQAKFWEIEQYDEVVVTTQGMIGRDGKEKEKSFVDDMAAEVFQFQVVDVFTFFQGNGLVDCFLERAHFVRFFERTAVFSVTVQIKA